MWITLGKVAGIVGNNSDYFVRETGLAGNSTGTMDFTRSQQGTFSIGTHTISAYADMGCEVNEGESKWTNNSAGPVSVIDPVPPPGAFDLSSPADDAVNQPGNPTLQWGTSTGAVSYEYCINSIASCVSPASWISTSASTSISLSGLTPGGTYYWQVRARNPGGLTYGNGGTISTGWFSFTVLPLPGAFSKISPAINASNQPADLSLTWGTSSDAISYSYCMNSTASCTAPAAWISTGAGTSVNLSGLTPGVKYYWQVRATNASGTTNGNSSAWWSFTIKPLPGTFNKSSPSNGASNQLTNPTLNWGASSNVSIYQYCIDNSTNNSVCNSSWVSVGSSPSVTLADLAPGTYYWQVTAVNSMGTRDANAGAWWSFTIAPYPGPFNKSLPGDGVSDQPTNPTLSWGTSAGATSYAYCIDTVGDDSCNGSWVSTGTSRTRALSGLLPGTTYYWQVRSSNTTGIDLCGWRLLARGGRLLFRLYPVGL